MKYGQTLPQWSTPEWEAYNVDFNQIKRLIKERTKAPNSDAIAIPGHGVDEAPTGSFEEELFAELQDQYEGVQLFVRSKTGEIKRRLNHLQKVIVHLQFKLRAGTRKRIPIRLLERFSKVEGDVVKAGEDVQSLARFVGAQKVAFAKLLKKYRKWTQSPNLDQRFEREVLGNGEILNERELEPLVLQLTETLNNVRAPFTAGLTWEPAGKLSPTASVHESRTIDPKSEGFRNNTLISLCEHGSGIEIDNTLATFPLGGNAGHTTYWIHQDNLLQLHILLLQQTRLLVSDSASTSRESPSKRPSPQSSIRGLAGTNFFGSDEAGVIFCDELSTFASSRSGTTIQDIESCPGRKLEEASLIIRYSRAGEALLTVSKPSITEARYHHYDHSSTLQCKTKRKLLGMFFDSKQKYTAGEFLKSNATGKDEEAHYSSPDQVRDWIQAHQEIRPLVHMQCKRSRFVALNNCDTYGTWLTLDKDIIFGKASIENFGVDMAGLSEHEKFPYAVLEIRWEGQRPPDLVNLLNNTHLAEHVPGFSLENHTVATLYNEVGVPAPFWLPALQKDIKKLPRRTSGSRRVSISDNAAESSRSQLHSASTASTPDIPSSSGFSQLQPDSPATSLVDQSEALPRQVSGKKRQYRRDRRRRDSEVLTIQRYWNEFDDGDQISASEAYTILVDPEKSSTAFPQWSSIRSWALKITKTFGPSSQNKAHDGQKERRPLLIHNSLSYQAVAEESDGDLDTSSKPNTPIYHTFPPPRRPVISDYQAIADPVELPTKYSLEARNRSFARWTIAFFLASLALMFMAGLLVITRRKHYIMIAEVGAILTVIASMLCVITALGLSAARESDTDWLRKAQIALGFGLPCLGNGIIVVMLAGG